MSITIIIINVIVIELSVKLVNCKVSQNKPTTVCYNIYKEMQNNNKTTVTVDCLFTL